LRWLRSLRVAIGSGLPLRQRLSLLHSSAPRYSPRALGQAAGATLAAFTGAYLLHRIAEFDSSLSRLRDALALIRVGALGSAVLSATIGVSVLYAADVRAYSGLGSAWLIYWLGDATGVLLVTPLILTLHDFLWIRERTRITELAVLLLLLTVVSSLVFGDPNLIPVGCTFWPSWYCRL
jgi:integral membrane sensor domain MASE1